jgi:hypothetical protein
MRRNLIPSFSTAFAPAAVFSFLALFSLALAPALSSQSLGYSYLRISVSGRPATNFVHDSKYRGWLQVEEVQALVHAAAQSTDAQPKKAERGHWIALPEFLASGRSGPGRLRFGAGDDGALGPLVDAQEHNTLIPNAELALYDVDTAKFVGEYEITGIRILSLDNIAASACPMFEITATFQHIAKK